YIVLLFSPFFFYFLVPHRALHSFPTRRSSDLAGTSFLPPALFTLRKAMSKLLFGLVRPTTVTSFSSVPSDSVTLTLVVPSGTTRSEEHTSELQSLAYLVCRLLLEKKKKTRYNS